jgi:hypothetical protein
MASSYIQNAPTNLDIPKFYATVLKDGFGLAKAARYAVRINLPQILVGSKALADEMVYLCEAAEIPGRVLNTMEYRYYGPTVKAPYQSVWNEIALTFMCRDLMREKELFDTWMERINPSTTFDFLYKSQYQCTIEVFTIMQGQMEGNPSMASYLLRLDEAFPTLIAAMPANFGDDQYHRLTVSFAFTKTNRPNIDQQSAPAFQLIQGDGTVHIDRGAGSSFPVIK